MPLPNRAEFARAMAKIEPGTTTAGEVRELLGEPDDVRTRRDPGGISATRTEEIWRYGSAGHLSFPTLGQVHIQADGVVQYTFGGRGAPPPPALFSEAELRQLLRVVDRVPSYNAGSDYGPLPVIQAVNRLHPLGKDKALAVVTEYLRVSSWFDDPAREGTFLLLRSLFEVPDPPGHFPVMMVGAPAPPPPADPTTWPRFPLVIAEGVPFLLVTGYMLAGKAEPPEWQLKYFEQHGVIRAKPLRPTDDPIALVDRMVGSAGTEFLAQGNLDNDWGRDHLINQALRLIDSVYRTEPDVYGARFSVGKELDKRWAATRAEIAKLSIRWDERDARYVFADGTALAEDQGVSPNDR